MPFFEDHSYRKCVTEFKSQAKPNREWEFYMKNDNFTVYRRPAVGRNPDLYSYKAFGGWKDVKPDTLANVYLDLDFRKKWDKYMKTHKYFEVKSDSKEYTGIHFEMNYPWPLSNRDYAYVMETKLVKDGDDKYQVILGESLPSGSYPVSKGVIRIDTYMQNICITRGSGGQGCTIALDYFDDPKGNIPKSVINWAAKIAVPGFINSLKAACALYEKDRISSKPLDSTETIEL